MRGHFHRVGLGLASLVVLLTIGLLGPTSPASAITEGHAFSFSFGSQGTGPGQLEFTYGTGVAVDQSNGDVYVTDGYSHRVEKFDEHGNFLLAFGYGVKNGANEAQVCVAPEACHPGISGASPGQFEHPDGLAVDNSGGENNGDVYVVDAGDPAGDPGLNYILKFDEHGHYLSTIDGSGSPQGVFSGLSWQGPVAVDAEGHVWVTSNNAVLKFSNEADNEYAGGSEWLATNGGNSSIAVNPTGSKVFLYGYGGEGGAVWKYSANGASRDKIVEGPRFSGTGWLAFDQLSEHFFASVEGGGIIEFTTAGQPIGEGFGNGLLGFSQGIAVNGHTNTVYVSDASSERVDVFVPRTVPAVTTGEVTNVGHESATLTGEITPDGGNVTECKFEFGTDTSYGTVVPCKEALPYSEPKTVTAEISGLTRETTYHYRLVAANAIAANQGQDQTFTPHGVLGLTTEKASELTPNGATLNASFDPNHEATKYHFEWGLDTSYGTETPVAEVPASASGKMTVSAPLAGLGGYTAYHFRVVAENSLGVSYGNDLVVRTAPPEPPEVSGSSASAVTDATAQLSAKVNPNLGETVYRFQYGTDSSYGSVTPTSEPIGDDQALHPVATPIADLQPDTTYHFRIVATNFGGTTAGPDMTFRTAGPPVVGEASVSAITRSGATLSATIRPALSSTTVHFDFGRSTSYEDRTAESAVLGSDNGLYTQTATLSGLQPGTEYHFRAVASNAYGVSVGPDQTFMTAAEPSPPPPPPARCKRGFVKKHGRCVKRHKAKAHRRHGHRAHGGV